MPSFSDFEKLRCCKLYIAHINHGMDICHPNADKSPTIYNIYFIYIYISSTSVNDQLGSGNVKLSELL